MHRVSRPGATVRWHDGWVSEPMHANGVDTSEGVVRALLRDQRPQWADLPMNRARTYLSGPPTG